MVDVLLALLLVELTEAWVDPYRERVRAQQPRAEAVDRRDPGAVELLCEVEAAAREVLDAAGIALYTDLDEALADVRRHLTC